MNVYLTGDTHGRFERIACFCRDNHTTLGDVLIILGDAGVNYYLNHRDYVNAAEVMCAAAFAVSPFPRGYAYPHSRGTL